MYAQGDYLQINSLKTKAKQNFEESLMNSPIESHSTLLSLKCTTQQERMIVDSETLLSG